jgi:aryl-phospho-beta-D-glucosidase BglC (GH1 family)
MPDLTWRALPRWRGFNLLERFRIDTPATNRDFQEWDLDAMADWGFDFVRVPADYRAWTKPDGSVDESALRSIERLVELASDRGIHVNLSLHRAPGYIVGRSAGGEYDLWDSGPEAERAMADFAAQWSLLADRFDSIPAQKLSFGLINEPPDVSGSQYAGVVAPAVKAIRDRRPDRLIIADGTGFGREPVAELVALGLAQATRGYDPMRVTHYQADWINNSSAWPAPTWPLQIGPPATLFGDLKDSLQRPLVLRGVFPAGPASIRIDQVSAHATLVITADSQTVLQHQFVPGPGKGEWQKSTYRPKWKDYEATYDRDFTFELQRDATELTLRVTRGDWLTFTSLSVGSVRIVPDEQPFGTRQGAFTVSADGTTTAQSGATRDDRTTLSNQAQRWQSFGQQQGTGIYVGEFGVFNRTPHDVSLAFMRDALESWYAARMGWALWNLRGPFGIVDSDRSDVRYENYQGHLIDRRMLELLLEN